MPPAPGGRSGPSGRSGPRPSSDDVDPFAFNDVEEDDPITQFAPTGDLDLGREPAPALLAARAEPLGSGGSDRSAARRRSTRNSRPGGSEAARRKGNRPANRRKPKEPSRLLLGVGLVAVLLAGFAAAYWFTQRQASDEQPSDDLAGPSASADTDETLASTAESTTPTTAAPTGEPPTVVFDEAAVGPITAGEPYTLSVGGGPEGASYQLLVDGAPAAEPAPSLAPVTFTEGRHLLEIAITSPAGNVSTNPVLVYAVPGTAPEAAWRANLKSVDIEGEGWALAVQSYDEFVAQGHTDLQLMPSAAYPSLTQGYWNLFIGGFESRDAAVAYCEQYGLTVPTECYVVYADPAAPASG